MPSIDRTQLLRLFESLRSALVLYARTWVDADLAADAVQDAFVRLSTLHHPPANPRAWLYLAVKHRSISLLRSARRRQRRERARPSLASPALLVGAGFLVDHDAVEAALRDLPAEEREAVVLRLWTDLTLRDIGEILGVSTATAHRRYQSALAAIRSRLESPCPHPPRPRTETPR